MKLALKLLFILLLSSCGKDIPPKTLWHDFKAREAVRSARYEDALLRYFQLLESDGDRFATHSNIGVLLNKMQKPEDALKSLQHALKLAEAQKDAAGVFAVNFNLGVYFGARKRVKEALEFYQAALEVNPVSVETKTNIELLIRQQQQEQQEKNKQGEGQGESQSDEKNDPKEGDKGQSENEKQEDQKGDQKDDEGEKPQDQPRQSSPKYKPRPFKGDELSEGDVKKILGELKNQEQKIRANFDKNEKGKSRDNEKDW